MYKSDFHIHSEVSYDAKLTVQELFESTKRQGITEFGVTDHVNQPSWKHYLQESRKQQDENPHPGYHLGVELTTISGFLHDYDRLHGNTTDYQRPDTTQDDPIQLSLNAEELEECGVEYTLGAAHWCLTPKRDMASVALDFHRQLLYLACDPRVDIVGHPFWIYGQFELPNGTKAPFGDMKFIPDSCWDEFAAALLENKKYVEYNVLSFAGDGFPEKFQHQYAEKIRYLFEKGVPVTIGTDEHGPLYGDHQEMAAKYLKPAGFKEDDFSIPKFWRRK